MPLTLDEFNRRQAALLASRAARERGDFATALAAYSDVESIEASARQREEAANRTLPNHRREEELRERVETLESRLRSLRERLGSR